MGKIVGLTFKEKKPKADKPKAEKPEGGEKKPENK